MTADTVGGVWTYALDLIEALGRSGLSTLLLVPGPAPSTRQRLEVARLAGVTLVAIDGPLDWTARSIEELRRTAAAVATAAKSLDADLVHLNSPALAALATFEAPVLGVCHSCLGTWWQAVKGEALPEEFAWRTRLLADGYAAAARLAAPSYAFAAATASLYDVPKPTVVWNGRHAPKPQGSSKEPLVLTAGRLWDQGKDVRTLDRAASRLKTPFVALGSLAGPDGSRVEFDHLRAIGQLDTVEVAGWMARGTIFASAALYEPFGLAVLEAAQAGMALVLSDIASFRELWADAAVFVSPGDASGFAATIDGLIGNPAHVAAMAAAARSRARRYSVAAMTRGYLKLYSSLAPRAFAGLGAGADTGEAWI